MNAKKIAIATFFFAALGLSRAEFLSTCFASAASEAQVAGQPAVARRIGAIKAINGNAITLTPDSGPEVTVTVQTNARILRNAPGEKDMKNATLVQLQDLHVGDRIRFFFSSRRRHTISALEVI